MYGEHVKWAVNMATAELAPELLRYVRQMACRAVARAVESPPGPVQINFPFREPLVPDAIPAAFEVQDTQRRDSAFTEVGIGRSQIDQEQLVQVAMGLEGKERGVIICGPQDDPEFAASISTLANKLGFPILADPLSQVRCGTHDRSTVIDCYDGFLRSTKVVQALRPEIVLRFGATPTSKVLLNYLAQQRDAPQISVQEGNWQDPDHLTTEMFQTNPNQFTRDLAHIMAPTKNKGWLELWSAVAEKSRSMIADELRNIGEVFEGKVFSELAALLPSKATLFAGNSLPVRDLDGFYPTSSQEIRFLGNRGASGIDGVLSTSLGTAALAQNPLVTVLGDLSFYHDMNGLLAAQKFKLNATIIILNNNGGGIFSFLPQHDHPEYFEKYFGTPHGLTFEHAATLYKLEYNYVASWTEFRKVVLGHFGSLGTKIVELNSDRQRSVELHHRILSVVTKAAEQIISERV
jgi:2-succinyl-5-enolpyruvyl-6-hydroxy-3-cyclohexene-1-carboxylate synthase